MKKKIIFKTQAPDGHLIDSSAILYTVAKPHYLIVVHHGTIFSNDMAPSQAPMYDQIAELFLKRNCSVIFPDYIGFGISFDTHYHPYLHKKSLARNSMCLIESLYKQDLIYSKCKILSVGYSEGGYASLAFVELAQKYGIILDSINGSGPYNLQHTLDKTLQSTHYEFSEYISYVAHSYEKIYNLKGLVNNLFTGIYPKLTYKAYQNRFTFEKIHNCYPSELNRFLNFEFLNGDSDLLVDFKDKLQENTLSTFIPKGHTTLFSAQYDEVVNVDVSKSTYKMLKEKGAKNIHLVIDDDLESSHFKSYPQFLKLIVDYIDANSS